MQLCCAAQLEAVRQLHKGGSSKLDSVIREIRSNIETVERQQVLYEVTNFSDRAEALDFLESHVIDRIEGLLLQDGWSEPLSGLMRYAEKVRLGLEGVDQGLFRRLREDIASGNCTSSDLRNRITMYARRASSGGTHSAEGYDSLDALVSGLFLTEVAPEVPSQRDPEMVAYQPAPARVTLELVERADFRQHDVFYDIGSGLGLVPILVHLLTGVRARGVEVEPAYCEYARRRASALRLSEVQFFNVDARKADYSDGTVFFLYSPFEGNMLEQVLEGLRHESTTRSIRLCTYGPCTLQATQQKWLEPLDQNGNHVNRLAIFATRQ